MNNMKISMAFVIMMTLVNGFFSGNILNSNTTFYSEEINNLNKEKLELENELNEFL